MREIQNIQDFNQIIEGDKPFVLDFYADWCGPCQSLLPTLEKVSEKYKDEVVIAKINVDKNRELAGHFKVRSIPALFFIQDGKVVNQLTGLQSQSKLEETINVFKKEVEA